jgi:hypothetical protein
MENALIGEFSVQAHRRFHELHQEGKPEPYLIGSALCGQDTALADYFFGAGGRFALIEFKANAEGLKTEGAKPQRRRLLDACLADSGLLARSRAIHHAAWGEPAQCELPGLGTQTTIELALAPYADKVGKILGLGIPGKSKANWTTTSYLRSYFEDRIPGSNVHRFKRYLGELYALVGMGGATGLAGFQGLVTVYIPARNHSPQWQTITFNSFEHLMELTIHFKPERLRDPALDRTQSAERNRPRPRGPSHGQER